MLKRRNVRVKAMQVYYTLKHDDSLTDKHVPSMIKSSLHQAYRLYLYHLYTLRRLAFETENLADSQTKKIAESNRLVVSRALLENPVLQMLEQDGTAKKLIDKENFDKLADPDMIPKLFRELNSNETFIQYSAQALKDQNDHRNHCIWLLTDFLMSSELFTDHLAYAFHNCNDDLDICQSHLVKTIKESSKLGKLTISEEQMQENLDFGVDLLKKSIANEAGHRSLIEPKLQNWEFDRVATLDILLLNLALSELQYFPNIPVKVTINEYLDIAKAYSSPKSKDFVNGVLDRCLKELKSQGDIQKEGRGLIE